MKHNKNTAILIAAVAFLASCDDARQYDATGIFEATTVTVSAETAGKILEMNLSEGDTLAMGQQVGLIDTTLLELQSLQLESQKSAAESSSPDIEAQVASLRSQIAHQESECARISGLLADGAATQKQSDDAYAQLRILRGQLDGLLSSLNKSRSTIGDNANAIGYQRRQVEQQITKSKISVPISGTVLAKYMEAGEYATPGKPLFKIADLGNIYLRCYFTAEQVADLKIGQKVTVTADFGGDKQYDYKGTVIWIAQESEFTPKSIQTRDTRANLVYAVKVAVRNDGRLKLGQYGEVKL